MVRARHSIHGSSAVPAGMISITHLSFLVVSIVSIVSISPWKNLFYQYGVYTDSTVSFLECSMYRVTLMVKMQALYTSSRVTLLHKIALVV